MLDRSFLPPARFEFVVVADTHYMADPGAQAVEFESRRRQAARAGYALDLAASAQVPFAIHLGDLVQEYPGSPGYVQTITEAREQLARLGPRVHQVAGNHEIGDKPDPTMPVEPANSTILADYHARFGRSWYSFDAGGAHFVILNSPLLNTGLPEDDEQRRWLEADLRQRAGQRIFVFTHYPPFLVEEGEHALGHYDNLGEPARSWLLSLIREYDVELLFAAHTHFRFFNRVGRARYLVAPSTSFTRPGFSEIFSSGPPDERGRNDVAKLGFFLVRVHDDAARVHLIRTNGLVVPATDPEPARVVTGTPRDLPNSPLGISAWHRLADAGEVPLAWPSAIRQPVRNDYPLLACLELGARRIRVPGRDLADPLQRARLAILRDEGVAIDATWLCAGGDEQFKEIARAREECDGVELQVPGTPWPTADCLTLIRRCTTELDRPVTLAPVISRERVAGKQHPRTRTGYALAELPELNDRLARERIRIARVLVRVAADSWPWDAVLAARASGAFSQIGAVDWAVELAATDPAAHLARAAEAAFAMALVPGARLFLEPLIDLDRTMDVVHGLLDRQCNPRPAFHAVACLNTVLFGGSTDYRPLAGPTIPDVRILGLTSESGAAWLVLPTAGCSERITAWLESSEPVGRTSSIQRICLANGTIEPLALATDSAAPTPLTLDGPTLLLARTGQTIQFGQS